MKRKRGATRTVAKSTGLRPTHPLVGTWQEEDNPVYRTSVVYKVEVAKGCFAISGLDEADGELLMVSEIKWDGEELHFTTFFPPTKHKARHVMRLVERGRANHQVDGIWEIWKKMPQKSKMATSARQSRP